MTDKPVRVQLSRRKGWKMPANTVKVTRPTAWGNPFVIGGPPPTGVADAEHAVAAYRELINLKTASLNRYHIRAMLRGKNLACWCKVGEPCHADVLLELANAP